MTDDTPWQYLSNALGDLGGYELGDSSSIEQAQRLFRLAVGNDDQAQAAIQEAWKIGDAAIQRQQDAYLAKIDAARAAGTPITEAWLYQVGRLDQLRASIARQYTALGITTNAAITSAQRQAGDAPVEALQRLIQNSLGVGPQALDFGALDVDRMLFPLVGTLQNGSPLRDLTFSNLTVDGANSVAQALVRGAISGASIRDIAASMRLERNLTLARASLIARTEILRANRAASLATMRAARVSPMGNMGGDPRLVKGWRWSAAPAARRVCGLCMALQGSLHPITEDFASHPGCRCAPVPVTVTWADLGVPGIPDTNPTMPTAADWWHDLPHQRLVEAYGPVRADLIRQGYLKPMDLVSSVNRGRWGIQPRLSTVSQAIHTATLRGYVPPPPKPPPGGAVVPPPAPPKVKPTTDVPGLDVDLVPKLGTPSSKALDDFHDYLVEYDRKRQAMLDEQRAIVQAGGSRYGPEFEAVRTRMSALDTESLTRQRALTDVVKAERQALLDRITAARGTIPDSQARRMIAQLDTELDRWLKVQDARFPTRSGMIFDPAHTSWAQAVQSYRYLSRDIRRAVAYDLPLRERLHMVSPEDRISLGGHTVYGGGKVYAQALATWNEMVDVVAWQERTFGWRTQWSGQLQLSAGRGAAGIFEWNDSIGIARDYVARTGDRLKVGLHELFHGMSGGGARMTPSQFTAAAGWEEGVVERLAQIYEHDATVAAGLQWDHPAYTTYQHYTKPLEEARQALGIDERQFYGDLIAVPVSERRALVEGWITNRISDPDVVDTLERHLRALMGPPRRS